MLPFLWEILCLQRSRLVCRRMNRVHGTLCLDLGVGSFRPDPSSRTFLESRFCCKQALSALSVSCLQCFACWSGIWRLSRKPDQLRKAKLLGAPTNRAISASLERAKTASRGIENRDSSLSLWPCGFQHSFVMILFKLPTRPFLPSLHSLFIYLFTYSSIYRFRHFFIKSMHFVLFLVVVYSVTRLKPLWCCFCLLFTRLDVSNRLPLTVTFRSETYYNQQLKSNPK